MVPHHALFTIDIPASFLICGLCITAGTPLHSRL